MKYLSKEKGFSMTEIMLAGMIFSVVMGLVIIFFVNSWMSYSREKARTEVQKNVRLAMDWMISDIRNASGIGGSAPSPALTVNTANRTSTYSNGSNTFVMNYTTPILGTDTFGNFIYGNPSSITNNVLILKLPSIDTNNNIIAGKFDYIIYYRDPSNPRWLWRRVDPDPASSRGATTNLVIDNTESLSLAAYHNTNAEGDITATRTLNISLTTTTVVGGISYKGTLNSEVRLRNYQ